MSEARRIQYRREDATFVTKAPVRFTVERELPCSPARLFEVFEDAEAWTEWAGLAFVRWTSEKPYGPGTTRTVGIGPIEVDEVFSSFVPGQHMGFYFASGTTPLIAAFAEDYRVRPMDENRCHFAWTMGVELKGLARFLHPLIGFALERQCAGSLAKLEKYVDRRAP